MTYPNERDCEHGQLRRSCNICEYEKEIKDLTEKLRLADMFINKVDDKKYRQMKSSYRMLVEAI